MAGKLLIVFSVIAIAGCNLFEYSVPEPAWRTAPREYFCTTEQMAKVEPEAQFCRRNTSYLGEVCYGEAIIRNCTRHATQPLPPTNEDQP